MSALSPSVRTSFQSGRPPPGGLRPSRLRRLQLVQRLDAVLGIGHGSRTPCWSESPPPTYPRARSLSSASASISGCRLVARTQQVHRVEVAASVATTRGSWRHVVQLPRILLDGRTARTAARARTPAPGLDGDQLAPVVVEARIVRFRVRDRSSERIRRCLSAVRRRSLRRSLARSSAAGSRRRDPDGIGSPTRSIRVGVTSTSRASPLTRSPAGATPGAPGGTPGGGAMISGTSRVAPYRKMPCVGSPCSPSDSPWSAR